MGGTSQVNWYEDDVMLVVENASDDLLTRLALQVEGRAKTNIQANGQIDTGFMMNAVYSITPLANRRGAAEGQAGGRAERVMAPEPNVEEDEAAVHGAAEYTIYQELVNSFLYRALEQVQGEVGGMIREVGRAHLG